MGAQVANNPEKQSDKEIRFQQSSSQSTWVFIKWGAREPSELTENSRNQKTSVRITSTVPKPLLLIDHLCTAEVENLQDLKPLCTKIPDPLAGSLRFAGNF